MNSQNNAVLTLGSHKASEGFHIRANLQANLHDIEDRDLALQRALIEIEALKNTVAIGTRYITLMQQEIQATASKNTRLKKRLQRLSKRAVRIKQLAHHDALTGLPNRNLLLNRLKQARAQAGRENKQVALLFLDLDDFKIINDQCGHTVGDLLLKQVANRLLNNIRGGDTACRYGGDEFIVMLPTIDTQSHAEAVATKLMEALTAPYFIANHLVTINVSIGVSIWDNAEKDYDEFIRRADFAMYRAKARNRNAEHRVSVSMRHAAALPMNLEVAV